MNAPRAAAARRQTTALGDGKVHVGVVVVRRKQPVDSRVDVRRVARARLVLRLDRHGGGIRAVIPVREVTGSAAAKLTK